MKKFIVPLVTVAVVASIMFAGCVPGAAPPVTPPPVTPPPVTPPPVTPPPEAPEIPLSPSGTRVYSSKLANLNPFGENFAIKPDGTPYVFATTYIFVTVDPMAKWVANIHSLLKRGGAEYIDFDPNGDPQKQIAFVENLIAVRKPDALIMQSINEALLAPVTDQAAAAGIPTIAFDFDNYSENTVCTVYDHFRGDFGSNLLGEYFIELAERDNVHINVFEVWGDKSVDSSVARHEGFHSVVDARPDLITVMESGDLGWNSVELASTYVMDAFTAYPELNGTFQHGGGNAGSIEGLRAVDRLLPLGDPNHVYISTNDMDTSGVREMDNGFVDAFAQHGGWYVSDATVQVAFTHVVLGQPVPRYINLPLFVVTPDNIDTTYFFGALAAYPRMPLDPDLWPVLDFSPIGIEIPTEDMKATGYNPIAGYQDPTQAMYDAAVTQAELP